MPRPRFENADPAKQEAILQAAAKEFAHNGYEGASLNQILVAAGMSKGAFYYYFDDKADLAAEVLRWAFQDLLKLYDRFTAPADPDRFWDAMRDYAREGLAVFERSPYSMELASRLGLAAARDKALWERVSGTFSDAIGIFTEFLRGGQAIGAVRTDLTPEVLAGLMQSAKEAILRAYQPEGGVLDRNDFERLTDLQIDIYRRISAPAKEEA